MHVCVGCGSALQTSDPASPGYVPESTFRKEDALCRRCFRLRNYGEFMPVEVTEADYQREVQQIFDSPGLVLYVLDVFDLTGSMVPELRRFVLGSEVHVVLNKVDLMPTEVESDRLEQWVREAVEATGVSVTSVWFVSAKTGQGVARLQDKLQNEGDRPIYAVGMANVGKSTLLNRLLEGFGHKGSFTVSRVPGTTLGLSKIEVKLTNGDRIHIVDTPGLVENERVSEKLCTKCLKVVLPQRTLRPRIFQLNPGQSLLFGNVARLDFEHGDRQSFVCYISQDLVIHRTKLERADDIARNHANDILEVPCAACRETLGPLFKTKVATTRAALGLFVGRNGGDIVIPGLGFISLFGHKFDGTVHAPKHVPIEVRRRLIGDLSKSSFQA